MAKSKKAKSEEPEFKKIENQPGLYAYINLSRDPEITKKVRKLSSEVETEVNNHRLNHISEEVEE